ncbi:Similar to MIEN1: Migration and invasion enhancer 1 (Bos taurus) [Cotesia congregata]|uniref:Similar to MIEN1: Migration and invasion enhancer 1 (Bos taurus) n=1 Tax=Cotesia congregata TaxID=51543 RepID=A0A8J2HA88_COTCN|nr:Similar to MIEN1: Migration and invasion enhancer 1 (Bos taurus) [Cotesia congregata]
MAFPEYNEVIDVVKEVTAGSFEIKINDELIYSKSQTMAFPEYNEVIDVVKEVTAGQPPRKITKQQPIDCIIM